jgi:acyl carrier protein
LLDTVLSTGSHASQAALRAIVAENQGLRLHFEADRRSILLVQETTQQKQSPHVSARDSLRSVVANITNTPAAKSLELSAGSWLITGGTGALGGLVCNLLVADFSGKSFVTGTTGRSARFVGFRDGLISFLRDDLGCIADSNQLAATNLTGVIHAGGVLDDASLANQTSGRVRSVFAPKVSGARNLHYMTSALHSLSTTVLFSSITALIGSGGQSNYSAANAVLDAFATSEAYGGLPTASVQWGAWSDVGMAVRNEKTMRKLAQIGIIAFSPEEGLRAFTECLGSCGVQTVCAFDWYNLSCQGSNHAAYFELLQPLTGAIKQETIPDMNPFRSHVTIYEAVKSAVAEVLHCNIRDDQPLMDAGLDSLVATELAALVSRNTGIQLLSTLAFDYPTVNLIIAHVNEMIDPAHLDATEHSSLAAKLSAHSSNVHGIDIKSMAGCMPMTHMIKDCVQPISSRRWSADDEEDIRKNNGMNSRMGSTINDIEMFDSQLFGVHSIEASAIDPQQRMILVHILSMLDGICMRNRS